MDADPDRCSGRGYQRLSPLRSFLAVELPRSVRTGLAGPLDALAQLGLRPVAADAIHLTLHFLGDLELTLEEHLVSVIDQALLAVPSFSVRASGVGAFPSLSRPQVLWAGIETSEPLMDLHRRLGQSISTVGISVEERAFRPHLTLTRLRSRPSARMLRGIRDWSSTWAKQAFGTIPVESVILFHSQLGAGPARHTPVKSFRLK